MSLSRNREHNFPDEPPSDEWQECTRCGMPLPPGSEPRSYCSGLNQRGGGLQRSGGSLQRTPLSSVSDSNSGREHQKDEAFRAFVREQPCVACGDPPPSDPAHYRSWGSGHGDKRNLFPACRGCHTEQHGIGIESWQEKHDLDLESETDRIWREYKQFRRAKA